MVISISKGNVVVNSKYNSTALVLALTNDGKRAKLHRYGSDNEPVWHPVTWYEIATAGDVTCWKCNGSGLYYFGGMVLNGVYQGKTGPCFQCEGTGMEGDADRTRCWRYWHRGDGDAIPTDADDFGHYNASGE